MELKRTFYDFLVSWKAARRRECRAAFDGNVGVAGKKITMPHDRAMFLRPVNLGMQYE